MPCIGQPPGTVCCVSSNQAGTKADLRPFGNSAKTNGKDPDTVNDGKSGDLNIRKHLQAVDCREAGKMLEDEKRILPSTMRQICRRLTV